MNPTYTDLSGIISDIDALRNGKASTTHKATHAAGGTDALTPADIGAVEAFQIQGNPPETNIAPAAMELRDNEDLGGVAIKCDGRLDSPWSVLLPDKFRAAIGLGNVQNTADLDKPISSDGQLALDAKAPLTYFLSLCQCPDANFNTFYTFIGFQEGRPKYVAATGESISFNNEEWVVETAEQVTKYFNRRADLDPSTLTSGWKRWVGASALPISLTLQPYSLVPNKNTIGDPVVQAATELRMQEDNGATALIYSVEDDSWHILDPDNFRTAIGAAPAAQGAKADTAVQSLDAYDSIIATQLEKRGVVAIAAAELRLTGETQIPDPNNPNDDIDVQGAHLIALKGTTSGGTITWEVGGAGAFRSAIHAVSPAELATKQDAGDYATLVSGKVPAEQLPSYVDDVLEYKDRSVFPSTGEIGKIYVAVNGGIISATQYDNTQGFWGSNQILLVSQDGVYRGGTIRFENTGAIIIVRSGGGNDSGQPGGGYTSGVAVIGGGTRIIITASTPQVYRWSGTTYIEIAATPTPSSIGAANALHRHNELYSLNGTNHVELQNNGNLEIPSGGDVTKNGTPAYVVPANLVGSTNDVAPAATELRIVQEYLQSQEGGERESGGVALRLDTTNQVLDGDGNWQYAPWTVAQPENFRAAIGAAPLVHGHFQPNPEYAADSAANAQVSGFDGQPTAIFLRVNADYYQGDNIEYAITRQIYGGVADPWSLDYQPSDSGGGTVAVSTTATTYPWEATWTNGVTVAKAALPRIVAPLAATASEGTSVYAARADHAHPFPTAAQVGAAPAGNYATLDQTGKVFSSQLPSYVDDVVEYGTFSQLQADTSAQVGSKIYVIRDTGKIYRWSGYSYIEISNTLELGDLQLPDNIAAIVLNITNAAGGILTKEAALVNGKNSYSASGDNENWYVYYDGTRWRGGWSYSGDGDSSASTLAAVGNTTYPWQATGWTNGGSVARLGTYNASLAPAPLAADAYSGIGSKAAREDHVHPLPTPAAIGAATTVQGAKADSALQASALMPYRTSAAQDTIDAGKAPALSSNPNVASLAAGLYDEPNGSVQLQIRNSQVIIGNNLVKATFRSAIGAATAEQGAKADTALQPATTPLIPLLFGHSSYSYAAGGQTRFFSQIFDLSVAANSTARNFRFPANCTIKRAIFTVYNGGANAAAGHSGATLRLRNNSGGTSVNILSYNLNGLATEGSCSWRVIDLSIEGNISNDYVIEMETGTFSVAPTSVRQTLALYYL